MTDKITLDRAGRIVLPKPLRERMPLAPGDVLNLESEDDRVILRPIRPKAALKKEYGVWVYQGEPADVDIPALTDRERERRIRELLR